MRVGKELNIGSNEGIRREGLDYKRESRVLLQ